MDFKQDYGASRLLARSLIRGSYDDRMQRKVEKFVVVSVENKGKGRTFAWMDGSCPVFSGQSIINGYCALTFSGKRQRPLSPCKAICWKKGQTP